MNPSTLRVAFVTMQFPVPTETFASNDVKAQLKLGNDVRIYALRPKHPKSAQMLEERGLEGLRVFHNGLRESLFGLAYALGRPRLFLQALAWLVGCTWTRPVQLSRSVGLLPAAAAILQEISRTRPDFVHIAWGHYPSIVGFLVQRVLPEVATSISLAAYDLTLEFPGSIDVARRADFIRTLALVNVPQVTKFTGVSPEGVHVVYDGIDLERVRRLSRDWRKIPYRIAVASRLVPEKTVDDAIRLFAAVHQDHPESSLVVMGEGPERRNLESLCRELGIGHAVSFLGHVPQERVIEEVAQAEIALLTSVKESERLPNAIKEGMLCGCVVVASSTPGMDELIETGVTGFIYPPRDLAAAKQAIDVVFNGQVDVRTIRAAAAAHIEKRFNLDETARQYLQLWQDSLCRRRMGSAGSERRVGPGGAAPAAAAERTAMVGAPGRPSE